MNFLLKVASILCLFCVECIDSFFFFCFFFEGGGGGGGGGCIIIPMIFLLVHSTRNSCSHNLTSPFMVISSFMHLRH